MYYIGNQEAPQLTLELLDESVEPVKPDRMGRHVKTVNDEGKTPKETRVFYE